MTTLLDVIIQGVLLGGLYALFASGLSLIFGVMRLVNLAHGDLIVLSAFLILALVAFLGLPLPLAVLIALPLMFAVGYLLQATILNRAIGADILPPLLMTFGLSIIIQNGLLEAFSADSRRLSRRRPRDRVAAARRRHRHRRHAADDAGDGGAVIVGAQPALLPHRARPRLPRRLGRSVGRAADGHRQPQAVRRRHGHRAGGRRARRPVPRHPRQFRSDHRSGAADLRLRGGHHRRARQPVGHAGRRHRHRHRADRRRGDQSGMADPRRPSRLPGRADRQAARPVPARRRIEPACPRWP